ncbi:MFS transporter [Tengunoibacter tsumagoiensis]|uniref:Major facilitator superfamily (MFS) profile domain-containing protein n=1 Tax=Tengunoibacter tsumagoiensis TaxID=2014871 RepID=A0A401ZXY7_9CHLR|nr:MFS transporter [Tengunoibacter tsumagoiensis]GCE11693.1 hypothetical protein KTT_15520 [Tengunoibacter tsumagoiensis]
MQHTHSIQNKIILAVLCIAYGITGIMALLPGTTLLLLADHTHATLEMISFVITSSSIGMACGVFLAGQLSRKIPPKYLLMFALTMGAFILQGIFWTRSYWILLFAEFFFGITFAFSDLSLNVLMSRLFPRTLGRELNLLHSSFGVGALLGPLLITLSFALLHDVSWAYALASVLTLGAALLVAVQPVPIRSSQSTAEVQAVKNTRKPHLFGQLAFWLLVVQVFLYAGAEGGFGNWIVTVLSQSAHVQMAVAAPAASLLWLGLTLGRLLSTQLMRKMWVTEQKLLVLMLLGAGASGLGLAFSMRSLWLGFITTLLTGIFLGPIYPIIMATALRRFTHALSTASSSMLFSARASGLVFPILIGTLITNVGVTWAMIFPAATLLVTLLPVFIAQREQTLQSNVVGHTIQEPEATHTLIS